MSTSEVPGRLPAASLALALTLVAGLLIAWGASNAGAGNVTITHERLNEGFHPPDVEPHYYYLFNETTRRYEDVLQWNASAMWVSTRCAEGVATYRFEGNARLYLDGTTLKATVVPTLHSGEGAVPLKAGPWGFEDRGETLAISRQLAAPNITMFETWEFLFRLEPPKATYDVRNAGAMRCWLDWKVLAPQKAVAADALDRTGDTRVREYSGLKIDWSDFNESTEVLENKTRNECLVRFHPDGVLGDFVVDPSVSMSYGAMGTPAWVYLAFENTNSPTCPEVASWHFFDWFWYATSAPEYMYPVDSNPFPVDATTYVKVVCYDMWGRSWSSNSFDSGYGGECTMLDGDLPICWISVQCTNGARHDNFHRWAIRELGGGGPWLYVDEPVKFPVVVDDGDSANWQVWVPEDDMIDDAGTKTVYQSSLQDRREYVLYFLVTLKTEPTTVYLRMYHATTGEGIPWESFIVKWDDVITPTNVIQVMTGDSHTVLVQDFFGNQLYSDSVSGGNWDAPIHLWKIPVSVYSLKMFNQDPNYIHKMAVYFWIEGDPYEFYIAPAEVVEIQMKGGDYRIEWTPYHNYVAQETQEFEFTLSEAAYFIIDGATISQVISSVAGVYALQEVITSMVTPDTIFQMECAPRCPASMEADCDVTYVHPYAIVRATVSYTIEDVTSATLWLPYPDRAGRSYDVVSDYLYIASAYSTDIIINWTGNGTERHNSTNNPGTVDLADGGNYTVWSSASCTLTRVVTWREFSLFYWTYAMSQRRYEVSLWLNNTMNVTHRDLRWFVAWPEDSTIDIDGVLVEDLNNRVDLARGENFDVSVGGVSMAFTQLNASQVRSFRFTAWDANATETMTAPTIYCHGKAREKYDGKSRYYSSGSWTNDYALPYRGTVYITVKTDAEIDPASVVLYDTANSQEIGEEHYALAGNTLILDEDVVGAVEVGGALEYKVYYDERTGDAKLTLFSPLVAVAGLNLSLYWIAFAGSMVAVLFVENRMAGSDRHVIALIIFCLFTVAGLLHQQGVF